MGSTYAYPIEAPTIRISTGSEFRTALARVRKLEEVPPNTAEGLERSALEIAIATYLKHHRSPLDSQEKVGDRDG